jgi:virginiamycin A acetyltransferase
MLKAVVKTAANGIALACMAPLAALSGFGRLSIPFTMFAHAVALIPGLMGDYLRVAYYAMTLDSCSLYSRISFGSFFAHSSVSVARGVYIGAYCVIAACSIGERTQIGSHVQLFGSRHQHLRDECGRRLPCSPAVVRLRVGADCWIGASAVVMADIGDGATVGAGAVVPRPIPPHSIAVGNPAHVIREVSVGPECQR